MDPLNYGSTEQIGFILLLISFFAVDEIRKKLRENNVEKFIVRGRS